MRSYPDDRERRGVPTEELGGGGATGQDADLSGGGVGGQLAQKNLVGPPGGVVGHEERMQDERRGDRVGFFGERGTAGRRLALLSMRTEHGKVPLILAKFPNSLIGDGAPIRLPEGEVAVVIGRRVYAADGRVVHRNRTQSDKHRG
jgi:hypothetical protein